MQRTLPDNDECIGRAEKPFICELETVLPIMLSQLSKLLTNSLRLSLALTEFLDVRERRNVLCIVRGKRSRGVSCIG
jgi:hypothetical protein